MDADHVTPLPLRYLTDLTHSLIIPLEQYISSLMPLQKSVNPFRQPPLLHQFQHDAFLSGVSETKVVYMSRNNSNTSHIVTVTCNPNLGFIFRNKSLKVLTNT